SRANFNTWFKNTSIADRTEDTIFVGVPSGFIKDWIESHYHADMLKALKGIAPEIKHIKYQLGQAPTQSTQKNSTPQPNPGSVSPKTEQPSVVYSKSTTFESGNLNPAYIFESFIIGKHNELAHAASQAVSKNPGSLYNPLFLYGGVGLGK